VDSPYPYVQCNCHPKDRCHPPAVDCQGHMRQLAAACKRYLFAPCFHSVGGLGSPGGCERPGPHPLPSPRVSSSLSPFGLEELCLRGCAPSSATRHPWRSARTLAFTVGQPTVVCELVWQVVVSASARDFWLLLCLPLSRGRALEDGRGVEDFSWFSG
jgi:hypothetical protein